MKLRDVFLAVEILLLLVLFAAYMLASDIQQDYNRALNQKIAALKAEQDELLNQNAALKEQIRQLRAEICRAMETGRCAEEPGQ